MCRDTITHLEEKGKQTYNGQMKRFLHWLGRRRYPYEPLISVSISKSRLLANLNEFRKANPGVGVAPVLKSNAYGHGLFEVAEILEHSTKSPFFVVDSYFEAVALRARHFKTPLLVIGYTRPETIIGSHLTNVSFAITSLDALHDISRTRAHVNVHLKFDTGMHRQGILPGEVPAALAMLQQNPHISLEGICTHFADADNADASFTKRQIAAWDEIVKRFHLSFPSLKYIHAANTDGSRFSDQLRNNVMRLGIGLYGLSENAALNEKLRLEPVLEMKTIVTGVKKIQAGESVGYGETFTADREMAIATIPVGYYEGLDRRLSNKGMIQIGKDRASCPILGRVSMNITVVDVSAVEGVHIGTEAVVISRNAADANSIASISKLIGTITYTEAVHIPGQLKRVIVG